MHKTRARIIDCPDVAACSNAIISRFRTLRISVAHVQRLHTPFALFLFSFTLFFPLFFLPFPRPDPPYPRSSYAVHPTYIDCRNPKLQATSLRLKYLHATCMRMHNHGGGGGGGRTDGVVKIPAQSAAGTWRTRLCRRSAPSLNLSLHEFRRFPFPRPFALPFSLSFFLPFLSR